MTNLIVLNCSSSDLFVTGHLGDNLSGTSPNHKVPVGVPTVVATFTPARLGKSWDWMFLAAKPGEKQYQIYVEVTDLNRVYANFGLYDKDSSEWNSNPKPFPKGISAAIQLDSGDFLYVLLGQP